MDLGVTRRAIGIKGRPKLRDGVNIQSCTTAVIAVAMPDVATQAEEGRGLLEQVVGDGSMRLVADAAILGDGRVFIGKRALLLGVAFPTQHVDMLGLEISLQLPVRVVAVGADHLALLDRMMRRQGVLAEDLGMALVAGLGFLDRHGKPLEP